MSGRIIGGGRVLGSGKGIRPAVAAAPSASSSPAGPREFPGGSVGKRAASPFAPSESTHSLGGNSSSASGSVDLSGGAGDLLANISTTGPSQAASGNTLSCPICEEEMVTLLQLNRHLDDAHQELPEVEQDEVKTWFNKQVLKAKRFQPLSVLNQKLRGLDVFESNEPNQPPVLSSSAIVDDVIDPEELITRSHWQRQTSNDLCTDPACGKRLGSLNGSINCRGCGKLFCEEHTMYQMKLSRSAVHEPVRGIWARVCETCYKSREGYNDHRGRERNHTAAFIQMRTKRVERQNLDTARLEKRLTKLTRLLADPPPDMAAAAAATSNDGGLLSPIPSFMNQKNPRKLLEQTLVAWEEDSTVAKCPFCQQEFGSWTFRRHHCRICGRVVCADPETKCSTEVGLHVAPPTSPGLEKPMSPSAPPLSMDIRMCRECNHTIFSKRDFVESVNARPPIQRAYETLCQFERGIRSLMPSFHKALLALQPSQDGGDDDDSFSRPIRPPPTQAQIQDAAKIRKRLVDAFAKYGAAAKRIRDLPTDSPTQQELQTAVYMAASSFLHMHMLSLKSVPQMLRQRSGQHRHLTNGRLTPHAPHPSSSSLSPLRNGQSAAASSSASTTASDAGDTASQVSRASDAPSTVILEAEEKDLRERLVVLEEQRFLIGQMAAAARDARRFEEVAALGKNADELDEEITRVKTMVGEVEAKWEGLFAVGEAARV